MLKITGIFLLLFCLYSCDINKSKDETVSREPLMYEPSEMALLMRQMYEYNHMVKNQIIAKDSLLPFPEEFVTIHSAVLTDPSERNAEFDSLATLFIEQQRATFTVPSDSASYHFNKAVRTCVECHKTRCVGPIPKIKKLLIK